MEYSAFVNKLPLHIGDNKLPLRVNKKTGSLNTFFISVSDIENANIAFNFISIGLILCYLE